MGFRHISKRLKQRSKAAGKSWRFIKFPPTIVWCFIKIAHIRNQVVSFCFHVGIDHRRKFFVHIFAYFATQLVVLACQQCHNMLIVGAIAYVVIYENIWTQACKKLLETLSFGCIAFCEVAVKIKVLCITSKTIAFRAILICSAMTISVERAADVVHGYNHQYYIFRYLYAVSYRIAN